QMLDLNLNANLSGWCRAVIADLEMARELGLRMVNLSLPVSKLQIEAIAKNEEWVIGQLKLCLTYANQHFDFITVGAQDSSRADNLFLNRYIETAVSFNNVKRIRIADTVGIMNPFTVFDLFKGLIKTFPLTEFEFHGHNDLGMANANALAAVKAGAGAISGTVNGLGERCGNTPIEEFVLALQYSEGTDLGVNKLRLRSVCELVATITGRKIHRSKPFSGADCFTHESGIHTRSLLVNELSYQAFKAEDLGTEKRFVFGKHSGSAAVLAILKENGIVPDTQQLILLMEKVKSDSKFSTSGLMANDIIEMYRKMFGVEVVLTTKTTPPAYVLFH
ncbi:MAG: hypothetical protein JXR71_07535, partial [Bacteroidales bacterium]|nr:hypothetical protein [Bacteroidales bacterium]